MDYNCHEQTITNYFLLVLENIRLNKCLEKANAGSQTLYEDKFVLDRISHIEQTMGLQMKCKEERIKELECYSKELKSENLQICTEYQNLTAKHLNLQKEHENLIMVPKENKSEKEMQNYQLTIIQKEKQELIQQIDQIKQQTLKDLQTDLAILKRQNQNYIVSINNYRIENESYRNQKQNLEKEVKKLEEEIKVLMGNCQNLKNIGKQKQELEKQFDYAKGQNKKQFQKARDDFMKKLHQQKQKKELASMELDKIKGAFLETQQSLERKSKKLKEYDEQYNLYLTKMNNLTIQSMESKEEIKKMKQKYENLLTEEKQKSLAYTRQEEINGKILKQDFAKCLQKTISELQQKNIKQKLRLTNQINRLHKQKQEKETQHKVKQAKLLQDKNQTVAQWEELLIEMKKQKEIIAELEKNISSSLKNNISYTFSMKQLKGSLQEIKIEQNQTNPMPLKKNLQQDKQNSPQQTSLRTTQEQKANLCCQQCVSKKMVHSQRALEVCGKEKYSSLQNFHNESKIKLSKYQWQNSQFGGFESQQLRKSTETNTNASLSSKRKDDGFRKYDYIKNRIQESQEKIQSGYHKNVQFFQKSLKSEPSYTLQKSRRQWDSGQVQKNNLISRSIQKESISTKRTESEGKYKQERLMKSSSLRNVDYDSNLKEIQQYLSFDLKAMERPISRTSSDSKFQPPSSERSYNYINHDENADHSMLIEKLNKINSCRDQSKNKSYNFMKRPNVQPPNRTIFVDKRNQKQNINALITRKCMLIGQK